MQAPELLQELCSRWAGGSRWRSPWGRWWRSPRCATRGCPGTGPSPGPGACWGRWGGLRHGTATTCSHLHLLRHDVRPRASGCEACLALHLRWHNLRMCLTCGHVGCCDASFGRHALKHYEATGHPPPVAPPRPSRAPEPVPP